MSTTATRPIPKAEDIPTPTGGRVQYRFSDGQIVTGREENNSLQAVQKILGDLDRIFHYKGTTKDGRHFEQLEADIETAGGTMVRLKAGLTDNAGNLKPSVSALTFAEGLLEIEHRGRFIAQAAKSAKKNAFGTYTTYANLFHVIYVGEGENEQIKTPQVNKRPFDNTKSMEERWAELLVELQKHPAYRERPASETDDADGNPASHLSAFIKECTAKGWPNPEQAPDQWIIMVNKSVPDKEKSTTLSGFSDDVWGQLRLKLKDQKDCPKSLLEIKEKLGLAPAAESTEQEDPFE